MRHLRVAAALATFATTTLLLAGTASAQATRTWVSGTGDDANPCSRTAPCKTFAGAISKTAAGGEINVIDTGGFGAVTITKSITIQSQNVEAGVLVSGTNGIIVSAGAADVVNLVGLDFIYVGAAGAFDGVKVLQAAQVHIDNCIIRQFPSAGVHVIPNSTSHVLITDTIFDENLYGVAVTSANTGGGQAIGTLDHVTIFGKGPNSGSFGVAVDGAAGSVVLNNSTIVRNQTGLSETGSALLFSFGNNRVVQNQTNGATNQPLLTYQ
jgi:hypothetical protein